MAELALYRKHRSKSLDDVIGQDHITQTLKNAIKSGKISHAYLLTGPRGVGKTSVARILAHEVNGLEYDEKNTYLDIIEIDAASNRRIDEIRNLREKVNVAPVSAKYKVYIIDEVHMLTKEAFNALLKTLEEPPSHVIFVLATTEVHKLPDTIISRTQRFTFRPIDSSSAESHLKNIAKQEKIKITDDAISLIAEHGSGSFRDSISMLDQLSSTENEINADTVRLLLGIPDAESINELKNAVDNNEIPRLLTILADLEIAGVTATKIAETVSGNIRREIEQNNQVNETQIELLDDLSKVSSSPDPNIQLQLAFLRQCVQASPIVAAAPQKVAPHPKVSEPIKGPELKPEPKTEPEVKEEVKQTAKPQPTIKKSTAKKPTDWDSVLAEVKGVHNTLYGILRMAEPRRDDDKLILAFRFPFHQKQITNSQNMARVRTAVYKIYGDSTMIECIVDETIIPEEITSTPPEQNESLKTINNIFDGAELLES